MVEEVKKKLGANKITLILLTIFILGPLVFVGTCFPLGGYMYSFSSHWLNSWLNGMGQDILPEFVGVLVAIIVCYIVIKRILKNESSN